MPAGHNPAGSRKRLGATLKSLRNRTGLTLEQLGELVGVDRTQLGRVENGKWRVDVGQVMEILDNLRLEQGEYDKVVLLARAASQKGWWKAFRGPAFERQRGLAELEAGTTQIRTFSTVFVPGLLQTEEYSRVRFSGAHTVRRQQDVEQAVKARLTRQRQLDNESLAYEAILDEALLLRHTCPGQVMRDQLEHLAMIGTERENVTVRVLELSSPIHEHVEWFTGFLLCAYEDPDENDVVFVETLTYDPVLDDQEDLDWYESIYAQLRDAAASPEDSSKLIRAAAKRIDW